MMYSLLLLTGSFAMADTPPEPLPWSFRPVVVSSLPAIADAKWPKNDIDRFILAKLEAAGLSHSKPADKLTLLRRAAFDLTGLPPTLAELADFSTEYDANPRVAYEKLLDRLLATPAYGERWGRHWLDVVRYADSRDARGMGGDTDIAEAWRYRDWVIDAFNRDDAYDRFVVDQIAGDIIPAEKSGEINARGLIATGLLTLGEWGTGDADKEKMVSDIVDDQINVVSRSFLGLTIGCARCHDHKFDPISQKDYYGLAGIFFSTKILPGPGAKTNGSPLLRTPLAPPAEVARVNDYPKRLKETEAKLKQAKDRENVGVVNELKALTERYLVAAWEFRRDPAKKSVVEFAIERKLQPFVLQRWLDLVSTAVVYRPLSTSVRDMGGKPGIHAWRGKEDNPSVAINSTAADAMLFTFKLPPRSVSVHPGPKSAVVVAWESPIEGRVRLAGRVVDADPTCGDGITWRIDHRHRGIPAQLAAGEFANGGSQPFAEADAARRLSEVNVKIGDRLELLVFPKKEYTCDMTTVELEIAEIDGKRTWNLAKDIVSGPFLERRDRVWYFLDGGEAANSSDEFLAGLRRGFASAKLPADVGAVAKEMLLKSAKLDALIASFLDAPEADALLPDAARIDLTRLRKELDGLRKNPPAPLAMVLAAQEGGVPGGMFPGIQDVPIHLRGSYARLGEKVPRRFPTVLAGEKQPPITHGSGRLELAKWIADPKNPLTARVLVNRVWAWHFGEGIVRTPGNFGKLGEVPTHPELLDYLADRFVEGGWSIKKLHRLIMTSATYQQASPTRNAGLEDPENRFFGRMTPQRLEAESVRDALLAVAGNLDRTAGGMSFPDLKTPRRSVYLRTVRSDKSGFQCLFDAADPETPTEKRITTTVAPQALFLLNHPLAIEQAKLLAKRLKEMPAKSEEERIRFAYRLLYSREAKPAEVAVGMSFLNRSKEIGWEEYAQVLLCANEFIYVD